MTLPKCCGCQKIALASTSALLNADVRFQGCCQGPEPSLLKFWVRCFRIPRAPTLWIPLSGYVWIKLLSHRHVICLDMKEQYDSNLSISSVSSQDENAVSEGKLL